MEGRGNIDFSITVWSTTLYKKAFTAYVFICDQHSHLDPIKISLYLCELLWYITGVAILIPLYSLCTVSTVLSEGCCPDFMVHRGRKGHEEPALQFLCKYLKNGPNSKQIFKYILEIFFYNHYLFRIFFLPEFVIPVTFLKSIFAFFPQFKVNLYHNYEGFLLIYRNSDFHIC